MKRHNGIALVEVLVGILLLSIVTAIAMMALLPSSKTRSNASSVNAKEKVRLECLLEARAFQDSVITAHRRSKTHAWPDGDVTTVAALDQQLHGLVGGSGDDLHHLDGSMQRPVTLKKGWTYDFKKHTTNVAGCG